LQNAPLFLDFPGIDEYIDVYFEERIVDYYKPFDDGRFIRIRHEAVQCK